MRLVFDLEANGLYDDKPDCKAADTIWCIVTKDTNNNILKFSTESDNIEVGIAFLEQADVLIGHNIIDYDLRLLKKIYTNFSPKGKIFDTMILSQLLNPDRKGHSLDSYGKQFNRYKPEHTDWSAFSPEMLHRCQEDVEINHLTYDFLVNEAYEDIEGVPYNEIF